MGKRMSDFLRVRPCCLHCVDCFQGYNTKQEHPLEQVRLHDGMSTDFSDDSLMFLVSHVRHESYGYDVRCQMSGFLIGCGVNYVVRTYCTHILIEWLVCLLACLGLLSSSQE